MGTIALRPHHYIAKAILIIMKKLLTTILVIIQKLLTTKITVILIIRPNLLTTIPHSRS